MSIQHEADKSLQRSSQKVLVAVERSRCLAIELSGARDRPHATSPENRAGL
jgi:hypothetical protein